MSRKTLTAEVNPSVIRWARETAGLDTTMVARRLNVRPCTVEDWESGSSHPTFQRLEALATLYRRPLAAFFLPSAPTEPPWPHDFRVLPRRKGGALSRESRLAIREARRIQELASELAADLGREVRPRVAVTAPSADPESAANREREQLGVDAQEQFGWKDAHSALRNWRRVIESRQILTLQFPMPIEEMRGFCLPAGGLPAIVLNSRDVINGRIFTLIHEYAHVFLGSSAMCIPESGEDSPGDGGLTERFCNAFAGAFLVPRDSLLREVHERPVADSLPLGEMLDHLSARFKVSKHVLIRRLRDLGVVSRTESERKIRELESQQPGAQARARRGPSPAMRCVQERGSYFPGLVFQAQARDLITYSDVADYLSIRLRHLDRVQSLLGG